MERIKIVNLEKCEYSIRHGRYGGNAGDKDGIVYNGENWIVKYPKSTKTMQGNFLPDYTTSPLSEYIGSHVYNILGFHTHETILGIRNNKLVVACKDFQKHLGDLAEIRTIKNSANKQLSDIADEKLPESATGDKVVLEELMLHFEKNPLMQIPGLKEHFYDCMIVDILIGNNDRNNGNWGILFDEDKNKYTIAPVFDNGNAFNTKSNEDKIASLLNSQDINPILGERTIYTYKDKLLSAKKLLKLENTDLQDALLRIVPLIECKLEEIKDFINRLPNNYNGIDIISENRKAYYIKTIETREKELLYPAYENLIIKEGEKDVKLDK